MATRRPRGPSLQRTRRPKGGKAGLHAKKAAATRNALGQGDGSRERASRDSTRKEPRSLGKGQSPHPPGPEPAERVRPRREALSHVGGEVHLDGGSPSEQQALIQALAVTSEREQVLRHVHGFHSYPARLHPQTAARLVAELSQPGETVLDPFCGSGTVLVEARLLGRETLGVDANPLAIELCWLKTGGLSAGDREALRLAVDPIVAHAGARQQAKLGPVRPYPAEDRELFDPHVLLELDGLRDGIRHQVQRVEVRRALLLVLSSLLTKLSRKEGDSSERRGPRRLAAGYAMRFFAQKCRLLLDQLADFERLVPPRTSASGLWVGDARSLPVANACARLVVTSPPYPGVYDYHAHHATRLRWLGLDAATFKRRELGARRRFSRLDYARAVHLWHEDLRRCLGEIRRVLAPRGAAVLVVADSVVSGRPLYADETFDLVTPRAGLKVVAHAWQRRPHFHFPTREAFRDRPRAEHLFLLKPG